MLNIDSGMSPSDVQQLVENHLHEQLLKHFDPSKADDIFSTNKAPDWLDDMIAFAKWRQLFYKLIETYPDCVFLNYVIKLINLIWKPSTLYSTPVTLTELEDKNKLTYKFGDECKKPLY